MISAEAPILFVKAIEIFITELTHRAWLHTKTSKRRTLQVPSNFPIIKFQRKMIFYFMNQKRPAIFLKDFMGSNLKIFARTSVG